MTYSLTEIELEQTLRHSLCLLCSITQAAGEQFIRNLLWESVKS